MIISHKQNTTIMAILPSILKKAFQIPLLSGLSNIDSYLRQSYLSPVCQISSHLFHLFYKITMCVNNIQHNGQIIKLFHQTHVLMDNILMKKKKIFSNGYHFWIIKILSSLTSSKSILCVPISYDLSKFPWIICSKIYRSDCLNSRPQKLSEELSRHTNACCNDQLCRYVCCRHLWSGRVIDLHFYKLVVSKAITVKV